MRSRRWACCCWPSPAESLPLVFAGGVLTGAGGAGCGALIMAIIPGESAPAHLKGNRDGLQRRGRRDARRGRDVGGRSAGSPTALGLGVLPWVLLAVAVLVLLVTLGLRETAPKLVTLRAATAAA